MTSATGRAVRRAGPPGSAAVAAGSAEVVAAATETLVAGGSAVDAAISGGLAAVLSEPVLASLGGGGFLLHAPADGVPSVLDFFVDVPGIGGGPVDPHVSTVVVDFARTGSAAASSEQVFHGGWGTVAVPGCLDGYLAAHRRWGRLPLATVVAPALRFAREGVRLSDGQRIFLHLVTDLLALTPESRALFARAERDGHYVNPAFGSLLAELGDGRIQSMADPAVAEPLLAAAVAGGGLLTARDLADYRPVVRDALACERGAARVFTNPPPSVGGSIVVEALRRVAREAFDGPRWAALAEALADATVSQRAPGQVPTGTTHVSVVDASGAFASLTTSNGSGSGTVVPGWGLTLNNMLGEEDLRPADGSALPPGARMGSMMAPTLVDLADGSRVAMGTGGSERIRSALLCTLARLIDDGASLSEAIEGPRVHVTGTGPVHVEPGLPARDVVELEAVARRRGWPALEAWPSANLFFGGVHAVRRTADGSVEAVGDGRRSGAVGIVHPDGSVSLR